MRDPNIEDREQRLSQQYDQGVRQGANEWENQTLREFQRIRDGLRDYPIHELDRKPIAERMQTAIREEKKTTVAVLRLRYLIPTATAACFILGIILYGMNKDISASNPVHKIEFVSLNDDSRQPVSEQIQHHLQRGKSITVPDDASAHLTLTDGSQVECKPGTQIAVNYQEDREITLHRGTITVHATRMPDKHMIVKTPLTDVKVVGTVFWVEVLE